MFMLPVPVMSLLFRSKSPPRLGEASSDTFCSAESAVEPCADVANALASFPSNRSASRPEVAPSTVLSAVRISDAVWSAVAPASIPESLVFSASVNAFVCELFSDHA